MLNDVNTYSAKAFKRYSMVQCIIIGYVKLFPESVNI